MKRILLTLTAAIAAFPIWAAHPSHTNIWTGAGGDFNWNNAANWKDFATGGDWTPPTEATIKDAPAWNLVDFPADGTLVADYAGTLYVGGLLFGANRGKRPTWCHATRAKWNGRVRRRLAPVRVLL